MDRPPPPPYRFPPADRFDRDRAVPFPPRTPRPMPRPAFPPPFPLAAAALLLAAAPAFAQDGKDAAKPAAELPAAEQPAAERPAIDKAYVAQIEISGSFPEAPQAGGIFGSLTETLEDVKGRIERAAADTRIAAVLLTVDGPGVDYAKAREIRQSVQAVKDAGKPVWVSFDDVSTGGYLIACAGDTVVAPESGTFTVLGVRAEVEFYKELFDDFEVRPDVLRVGKYKAAAEPYTRTEMSEAFREELSEVLGDAYRNLVATIAEGRGLTEAQVKAAIDSGPHAAPAAKDAGLIDVLAYEDEIPALIAEELNAGEVSLREDYAKKKAKTYEGLSGLMELMTELGGKPKSAAPREPYVAVIYALGQIMPGKSLTSPFGTRVMGHETMIEAIDAAREDDNCKAAVLRVDSPGGSALASDLIWRALVRLKGEKPLIVSMGGVAGSGGYYIAAPGDVIVADPATITGSIGVVGLKLAFGEAFEEFGVTHSVVQYGENAGALSLLEVYDPAEKAAMTKLLATIYEQFTAKVADGRGMEQQRVKELGGGRIYSGARAKELGLVDELGTLHDAIRLAEQAAAEKYDDVDAGADLPRRNLPEPGNPFENLLEGGFPGILKVQEDAAVGAALRMLPAPLRGAVRRLHVFEALTNERAVTAMPFGLELK